MGLLSAVSQGLSFLNLSIDAVRWHDSIKELGQDSSDAEKAAVVVRGATLGFACLGEVHLAKGSSPTTLKKTRVAEWFVRTIQMSVEMNRSIERQESVFQVTNRIAIVGLGCIRAFTQAHMHHEQEYLALPEEEFAAATRPIYECDGDSLEVVGRKPLSVEECEANIASAQRTAEVLNTAGVVLSAAPPAAVTTSEICVALYNHILRLFPERRRPAGDIFQLRGRGDIPEPLHQDRVFRRYVCSITGEPIRDPVADPTTAGRALYEREAIVRWAHRNGTSPITRRRLTVAMLQERPAVKALIDGRLAFYEQDLRARAAVQREQVAPEGLDAAAQAEHPIEE